MFMFSVALVSWFYFVFDSTIQFPCFYFFLSISPPPHFYFLLCT